MLLCQYFSDNTMHIPILNKYLNIVSTKHCVIQNACVCKNTVSLIFESNKLIVTSVLFGISTSIHLEVLTSQFPKHVDGQW